MFLEWLWTVLGKIMFFTGTIGTKNSFPKPLSKEEEEYYLSKVAQGDKEARDILVKHNMRLVAHIVKKYTGAAETDDLISVGSIGLIKAINSFRAQEGEVLYKDVTSKVENGAVAGLVIGGALTLVHLIGTSLTGTSVNPARSLGPAIVQAIGGNMGGLTSVWIFIVAPLVGGALAAIVYSFISKEKAE